MAGLIDFGAIDPNAAAKGASSTNTLLQGFAQMRAGNQLTAGDEQGAENTLNNSGQLDEAAGLQKQHWAQDDRVAKMSQDEQARQAKFTVEAADTLYGVLQQHSKDADGGKAATLAAFDQLAPIMHTAFGMSPADVAQLKTALANGNTADILTALHGQAQEHLQVLTPGSQAIDPTTGQLKASAPFAPQTKIITNGDGTQRLIYIDPQGNPIPEGGPAGGPATAPATSVAAPAAAPAGGPSPPAARPALPASGPGSFTAAVQAGAPKPAIGGQPFPPPNVPGVAELATGTPKPADSWTTKRAGANDPLYREGTTYKVNDKTGEQQVVQQPPSAADAAAAAGTAPVKLTMGDSSYLNKLRTQVDEMGGVSSKLDQFIQLNREVPTGGAMALPGSGTVLSAFNPKIAQMKAITDQLTPAMRNGLPGAASDKDVAMFRGATVGLNKPLATNIAISNAMKAWTERQGDYIAFLEAFANSKGTLAGSREIWQKYAEDHPLFSPGGPDGMPRVNPRTPWRTAIDFGASPNSPPAPTGSKEWHWNSDTKKFE